MLAISSYEARRMATFDRNVYAPFSFYVADTKSGKSGTWKRTLVRKDAYSNCRVVAFQVFETLPALYKKPSKR